MGAFVAGKDELDVQLVDGQECEERTLWTLLRPLAYAVQPGQVVEVPAGFVTDLASIPEFAWSLGFPASGPWDKAAVVHDYLYATGGLSGRYSRAAADRILDQAMAACGVVLWKRAVIWAAVRLGGDSGWGR